MKRPYQKPTIYIESFELLEHIAYCSADPSITVVTYRSGNECTYSDKNFTLFSESNTSCINDYDHTMYDSLDDFVASFNPNNPDYTGVGCYNAFADGNFFAS